MDLTADSLCRALTRLPCDVRRLTNVLILAPNLLAEAPLLAKWFKTMGERAGIKGYIESGRQKERINNVATGMSPVV